MKDTEPIKKTCSTCNNSPLLIHAWNPICDTCNLEDPQMPDSKWIPLPVTKTPHRTHQYILQCLICKTIFHSTRRKAKYCPSHEVELRQKQARKSGRQAKLQPDLQVGDRQFNVRESRRKRDYLKKKNATDPIPPMMIYKRDRGLCQICGETGDTGLKWPQPIRMCMGHVIPIAKGGIHGPENIQLAHLECNMLKSDTVPRYLPQKPKTID